MDTFLLSIISFVLALKIQWTLCFTPSKTSAGRIFVIGFYHRKMTNNDKVRVDLLSIDYLEVAEVSISLPRKNFNVNITVTRLDPKTVDIPNTCVQTNAGKDSLGILIAAKVHLQVTASISFGADDMVGFQPYPVSTLGSRYVVITGKYMGWILLIGLDLVCTVSVHFPDKSTIPDQISTGPNVKTKKGETLEVTLQKFETYAIVSEQPDKTLDGAVINVTDSLYVGVLVGNVKSATGESAQAEWLIPVDVAGKAFLPPIPPNQKLQCSVKLVAIFPHTKVMTAQNSILNDIGDVSTISIDTSKDNAKGIVITNQSVMAVFILEEQTGKAISFTTLFSNERYQTVFAFAVPDKSAYSSSMILIGETNNDKLYKVNEKILLKCRPDHVNIDARATWAKIFRVQFSENGSYLVHHEQRTRKFMIYLTIQPKSGSKFLVIRPVSVNLEKDIKVCSPKLGTNLQSFYTMECLGRKGEKIQTLKTSDTRKLGRWSHWTEWTCPNPCQKTTYKLRTRECRSTTGSSREKAPYDVQCPGNDVELHKTDQCQAGANQTECPDECPLGKWDFNCTKDCPYGCVGNICERRTGKCHTCRCQYSNEPEHRQQCDVDPHRLYLLAFVSVPMLLILMPGLVGLIQDTMDLIQAVLHMRSKPESEVAEEVVEKQPEPGADTPEEGVTPVENEPSGLPEQKEPSAGTPE